MQHRAPLSEQYAGRWREVLAGLGIPATALVNRHGPCPVCGGKDRFRFDDMAGKGTFICSQCGAGDGPRLAMLFTGLDFRGLVAKLEGVEVAMPARPPRPQEPAQESAHKVERMKAIWRDAVEPGVNDPVSRYLAARLGKVPPGTGLRYLPRCQHPDGGTFPAMLAAFQGPDGKATGLHRTYLTTEGQKAPVSNAKLSFGELVGGGAVRLAPAGPILGIAEGIETALAASIIFRIPVWAALNANRLAVWEPPADVREVMILADNDENFVGQTAAFDLDAKLGGRVKVTIEVPTKADTDWCDMLALKILAR